MTSLKDVAVEEAFAQPVVGYFDPSLLIANDPVSFTLDFMTITVEDFKRFEIPYSFSINKPALMHGIASWFSVVFEGTDNTVELSTAPGDPDTHWYQCRLLMRDPLGVNKNQKVSGTIIMDANKHSSYDVKMDVQLDGTGVSGGNDIDLHNQFYHCK